MKSAFRLLFLPLFILLPALNLGAEISIETVFVGNPGNSPDPNDGDHSTEGIQNLGSVPYAYYIGKYEVTNAQWVEFLRAKATVDDPGGLGGSAYGAFDNRSGITRSFNDGVSTYTIKEGFENKPVNFVRFSQIVRFANWLTNGQGDGDTETGVYDLTDISVLVDNTLVRDEAAWNAGGVAIVSDEEWYKAAYHDPGPGGPAGDYWIYPVRSNLEPVPLPPNDTDPKSANLYAAFEFNGLSGHHSDVGAYTKAATYYGTFDQAGNLVEWTDTIAFVRSRVIRGGYFVGNPGDTRSEYRSATSASSSPLSILGFRVVSLEPIGVAPPVPWGIYSAIDGYADTGGWLGTLEVSNAPWAYSDKLSKYIYIPDESANSPTGGWVFIHK